MERRTDGGALGALDGKMWSDTENHRTSNVESQKVGMEYAMKELPVSTWSTAVFARTACTIPMGTAINMVNTYERPTRYAVFGMFWANSDATDWL